MLREQLIALLGRCAQIARRSHAVLYPAARRAFAVTAQTLKRGGLAALKSVEDVLLSASGRERVQATTTFALIFLFAVTSVDFLIAGGGEFGAPARAAPAQRVSYASANVDAQRNTEAAPRAQADQGAPTAIAPELAEAAQASVIPVSQSFEVLRTPAEPIPTSLEAAPAEQSESSTVLIGETVEEIVATPARKHGRVKGERVGAEDRRT